MRILFKSINNASVRRVECAALLLAACLVPIAGDAKGASDKTPSVKELKSEIDGLSPQDQITFLSGLRAEGRGGAAVSFYLGNAFLGIDSPDSAVVYYQEATAFDSTYTKAYVNLGIALEDLNRFDEAKFNYEQALKANPKDVLAHCHLGHYYHVRGEMSEAVDYYLRALDIDPKSAQAHYNLGIAFADSRLFAEAVREWETVVELDPDSELGKTAAENVRLIRTYMDIGRSGSGE